MGAATAVAVCLAPTPLKINGNSVQLDDGETLSLPSGVSVTLTDNAYAIKSPGGDIVRAEVNASWINVSVGVAPDSNVRGLLGNANGDTTDDIATQNGVVLVQPVSFVDLYQTYGDTWRVLPSSRCYRSAGTGTLNAATPRSHFTRPISILINRRVRERFARRRV